MRQKAMIYTVILALAMTCVGFAEGAGDAEGKNPERESPVISDGGHESFGQPMENAVNDDMARLNEQIENEQTEDQEMIRMTIGGTPVEVAWEDNESVDALRKLAANGLSIQMSMYGGFEQVGSIGQRLPSHDVQITTSAGEIVLYSSSQMVVFYGSNSWAYTRLGRITDKTPEEMRELLGNGDVTITLTVE